MIEQVSEHAVGDVVKIKFGYQVCEGILAEIGTPRAMNSCKERNILSGEYTPFSRKRQGSPESAISELTNAKKSEVDKESVIPQRSGCGRGQGRGNISRGVGTSRCDQGRCRVNCDRGG